MGSCLGTTVFPDGSPFSHPKHKVYFKREHTSIASKCKRMLSMYKNTWFPEPILSTRGEHYSIQPDEILCLPGKNQIPILHTMCLGEFVLSWLNKETETLRPSCNTPAENRNKLTKTCRPGQKNNLQRERERIHREKKVVKPVGKRVIRVHLSSKCPEL